MEDIRQYLISIVSASLISSLAVALPGKKSAVSAVTRLLAGLFLSITVLSPWTKLQKIDITRFWDSFETDAANLTASGKDMALETEAAIIKERTQAYILDKAASLGLTIEVEVTLADATPFLPQSVKVAGNISPYAKSQLQQFIETELGVSKENQSWT